MGSLAQNNNDDYSNERSLFVNLADTIVELGQSAGVKIFPYRDKRVPWFMAMTSTDRQKVISELQVFVDICQDCLAMGGSLTNSRSLVWCALKRLGLQQGSDLFTFITDEQVIEIYSYEQVQIFRNFNFFKYVSYTLEDIHCRKWYEIFCRPDNSIVDSISAEVAKLVQHYQVVDIDVPEHEVVEIDSIFNYRMKVKIHHGVNLMGRAGARQAFMVLEHAELTYKPTLAEQESLLLKELTSDHSETMNQVIQLFPENRLT